MVLETLLPVFVLSVMFGSTILITRIITDHRFRNKVLNAGKLDFDPELIKALVANKDPNNLAALKWGLIGFSAGLGLIIIHLTNIDVNSPLPFGIEIVAVATGFLAYFFIAKKMNN